MVHPTGNTIHNTSGYSRLGTYASHTVSGPLLRFLSMSYAICNIVAAWRHWAYTNVVNNISTLPRHLFTSLGSILLIWINSKEVIPSIIKYGMKLRIHSQRFHRWRLGMDKSFHPTISWACDYLSILGLKLIHVNKGAPDLFLSSVLALKRLVATHHCWMRYICSPNGNLQVWIRPIGSVREVWYRVLVTCFPYGSMFIFLMTRGLSVALGM